MNAHARQQNLKVAEMLECRVLPKVQHSYQQSLRNSPYEGSTANEDMLKAGIAFLRGENPHLSGFAPNMNCRWQGVEFVIWMKEIIEANLDPDTTAQEVLKWMTPFLTALLHHENLPQEIN